MVFAGPLQSARRCRHNVASAFLRLCVQLTKLSSCVHFAVLFPKDILFLVCLLWVFFNDYGTFPKLRITQSHRPSRLERASGAHLIQASTLNRDQISKGFVQLSAENVQNSPASAATCSSAYLSP